MSSALARFRKRQNGAALVEVSWPLGKPEFVFKVARFAHAEQRSAYFDAEKTLAQRGIDPLQAKRLDEEDRKVYDDELSGAFYSCLVDYIKRHVKSWTHTVADGEEPLPYSKQN